ncbi:MAG: HAD hydrolase family protein [Planctomycetes bacterium]|jgi:3-deoxy-D-manno-octulosonate 8-phosphate phosphatase (KDO 8-P phosphatase)|nr:HAD hydrolase family protein [Planctomycetota bacterium]
MEQAGAVSAPWQRALPGIRLVALDVDGVLTDGSVVYAGEVEVQRFHVQDGAAIVWLLRSGIQLAWITGRGSRATETRAAELRVQHLIQRSGPKDRALETLQRTLGIEPARTLAMGDDLADLALFERAAVRVAPANARDEVRARADFVTRAAGGMGAVREMAEHLLRARGDWDGLVAQAGALGS